MSTDPAVWAVIGDLVGSRRLPSRTRGQASLGAALREVNSMVAARQQLEATVGDEFQGVYASLEAALVATLAVRLLLPAPMDARFGIGRGTLRTVGTSRYGLVQDGPAWWAARDAIVDIEQRAAKLVGVRTMVRGWADETGAGIVNAYLMCRDEIVTACSERQRRIAVGLLRGQSQREIAAAEQVSASAVSQALRGSGIATVIASLPPVGA